MTNRPSFSSIDLWANHERRCLEVLRAALELLGLPDDTESEVDINRRLYGCLIRASHAIAARDGSESLAAPVPEGRNPPVASDAQRATREHKIPDFYWAYIDHLATNPMAAARQFVVECKRLTTRSRNWVYTAQYVDAGIVRFVTVEHSYGKESPSGVMVGYLQLMNLEQALSEVNARAVGKSLPPLHLVNNDGRMPVELSHELVRSFPDSPFRLIHLWLRA
jgi:hypothetical protein